MSSFVYDDLAVPDGKVNLRNLVGDPNNYITDAEWNLVMQYMEDIRTAIVSGDYTALRDYAAPVSADATARLRFLTDRLQASVDQSQYYTVAEKSPHTLNVMDFGAVADGATDNIAAFEAAVAAMGAGGRTLKVPQGSYRFSRALHIDHPMVLEGTGAPGNTATTIFTFPDGSDGIVIDRFNTTPTSFGGYVGDCSVVRYISVRQEAGSAGGHGFRLFARAAIEDCQVFGFAGDGVHIVAAFGGPAGEPFPTWAPNTAYAKGAYVFGLGGQWYVCHVAGTSAASGGPTGTPSYTTPIVDGGCTWSYISGSNANGWLLNRVRILNCDGNGVLVRGADSNAGLGIAVDVSNCTGIGINEDSFLGNTWIGCQVATCGGSYVTTGQANARNLFLGCYQESDTPGPIIDAPSQLIGGLILGATGTGTIFQSNGFGNPMAFAAANQMALSIGGAAAAPDSILRFRYASDGGTHDLKYLAPATDSTPVSNDVYVFDLSNSNKSWGFGHSVNSVIDLANNYEPRTVPNGSLFTWVNRGLLNEGNRIIHADDPSTRTESAFHFGDLVFRRGYTTGAAGDNVGWVCTDSGNYGTYSEGRTITTDGTVNGVLSSASSVLKVGDVIRVAGGAARLIRGIFGTAVKFDQTVAAGSGQAITYVAPVLVPFGNKLGATFLGNSSGSPGNATLNKRRGVSALAAGANSVVITNSKVPASACVIHAALQTIDATATRITHVIPNPAGGSFTVYFDGNATATTVFCWSIDE